MVQGATEMGQPSAEVGGSVEWPWGWGMNYTMEGKNSNHKKDAPVVFDSGHKTPWELSACQTLLIHSFKPSGENHILGLSKGTTKETKFPRRRHEIYFTEQNLNQDTRQKQ